LLVLGDKSRDALISYEKSIQDNGEMENDQEDADIDDGKKIATLMLLSFIYKKIKKMKGILRIYSPKLFDSSKFTVYFYFFCIYLFIL
jgi:hypothetical protein